MKSGYLGIGAVLLGLAVLTGCHREAAVHKGAGDIDRDRLLSAAQHPAEWLATGGDFGNTHYSGLTAINGKTVARLGYAWGFDTNTDRGLEATPIVVDGVMYTSGVAGRAYALDARSGKTIWRFEPKIDPRIYRSVCCDSVNRGVAVWRGKVYVAALDGILYALDAGTGKVVWSADTIIDRSRGYASTGAPEVAGNVVVIGNSGGEYDTRGYITAYDLDTGHQAWRFFTVPGDPRKPLENPDLATAARTWDPNSRWDVGGGGNVWSDMTYDPELNLLYVATGNGAMYDHDRRSPKGGDNLFLSSILAIRPDTGRLAWYYQETPSDEWDYDSDSPFLLATLKIGRRAHKVLMHAPKNGFFYVFDRATGKLLSAKPYVPMTWATGIDLKSGKPIENPDADYSKGAKLVYPSFVGGHNWNAMSFDPASGLVYLPIIEQGLIVYNLPDTARRPGLLNMDVGALSPLELKHPEALPKEIKTALDAGAFAHSTVDPQERAYLRAWDPVAQRTVWQVETSGAWDHAGALTTAGGLVFQGSTGGHLRAFDARTGKLMKDIDTGSSIIAAPMTYAIGGTQYVAVMAAWGGAGWFVSHPETAAYKYGNLGRILVFRLDGAATPKPQALPPLEPAPAPPPLTASKAQIDHGEALFTANCTACHANMPRAGSPDLTRLDGSVHEAFDNIVLGGLLKDQGMPQWSDVLSRDDADDIHAYLIKLAHDAYRKAQTPVSAEPGRTAPR